VVRTSTSTAPSESIVELDSLRRRGQSGFIVAIDSPTFRRIRALLVEAHTLSNDDWAERALNLFADVLCAARSAGPTSLRGRTVASHRAITDQAREALIGDPSLTVRQLARLVGYSPYYLSRIFRREAGVSISAHRLRPRTRTAIGRIDRGERNLARLAWELGFADHSHMTRMIVRECGRTPTSIRQLIHTDWLARGVPS
jgi:AraC-like DNA-binding protein